MSEKELELLALLKKNQGIYLNERKIVEEILNPDWKDDSRIHNWKNYVPLILKKMWTDLSIETRIVIFCFAEQRAGREDWD